MNLNFLKDAAGEIMNFTSRHPILLGSAIVVGSASWSVFYPWMALPFASSAVCGAIVAGSYLEDKKNIKDKMPEGEVWQRPYRKDMGMLRYFAIGLSLGLPIVFFGNGYRNQRLLSPATLSAISDELANRNQAGHIQRNVPFTIKLGQKSIQLKVTNVERTEDGDQVFDTDIAYDTEAAFLKDKEPVRQTQSLSLGMNNSCPGFHFGR